MKRASVNSRMPTTTNAPAPTAFEDTIYRCPFDTTSSGLPRSFGSHERTNQLVLALLEFLGGAARDHATFVQHSKLVADVPGAGNVVRDDDERGALLLTVHEELVDLASCDRIQTGARLVDEQDVGIERHRARQASALAHAT